MSKQVNLNISMTCALKTPFTSQARSEFALQGPNYCFYAEYNALL